MGVKDEPQDEFSDFGAPEGMLPSPVSWDGNPRPAGGSAGTGPLMAMDMDMDFDIRDVLQGR